LKFQLTIISQSATVAVAMCKGNRAVSFIPDKRCKATNTTEQTKQLLQEIRLSRP
jgi:hypothetical protein